MVVSSEECDENELFKPQLLDRPNKETAHMYPESVGIVFSRFSLTPRAKPLLVATLEAEKHSATAGCPLVLRHSGRRPGHPREAQK